MGTEPDHLDNRRRSLIARIWRRLTTPSAKWSVLTLVVLGLLVGAGVTIATQVVMSVTSSNEFCGGACHSMQWVAQEYRQSGHSANAIGVSAGCHDCHIPHAYPELIWYKAQAGLHDVIQEMRGTISTEEKFNKERLRLANVVWAEMKANNSENCQSCHRFDAEVVAKQKEFVRPMHQQFLAKSATCIDCHKGIAHTAPTE